MVNILEQGSQKQSDDSRQQRNETHFHRCFAQDGIKSLGNVGIGLNKDADKMPPMVPTDPQGINYCS